MSGLRNKVVIRKAVLADIDAMADLMELLFVAESGFAYDKFRQCQGLSLLLSSDNYCLIAAELNRSIIGMCTAQLMVSTAAGGVKALIEDLVVAEAYQGCGIGQRLLAEILQWAESRGAKRMDLLADCRNSRALTFYEGLGWRKTNLVCLQKD